MLQGARILSWGVGCRSVQVVHPSLVVISTVLVLVQSMQLGVQWVLAPCSQFVVVFAG